MDFEELYKKVENGTATDEEAAFVAREIVKAKKISSIIGDADDDFDEPPKAPAFEEAGMDTVQKARRSYNFKNTIRIIVIVLIMIALVTGGTLWYIFGTAAASAKKSASIDQEAAMDIARELAAEYTEADPDKLVVHDVDRHLDLSDGIRRAMRIYEIELRDGTREFEVRVNAVTGEARLTDIDMRDHY